MFRGATIIAIVWITVAIMYQQYFVPQFDPGGGEARRSPPVAAEGRSEPPARRPVPPLPRAKPEVIQSKPAPESPPPGQPAGPPELNQVAEVEMDPCPSSCTGSAFAVDRTGLWMTARHVVEGCQRVVVLAGEMLDASRVEMHSQADVALIWTGRGAPVLSFAPGQRGGGEDGYGYGFPAGEPGATHGQLLGRLRMRATGSMRFTAPITAWAERSRSPSGLVRLQGISGGPLLDSAGNVIGVMVASSKRRGRFFSAAIASIDEIIERAGVRVRRVQRDSGPVIADRSYPVHGDRLRARATVAQVGCLAQDGIQSRRPLLNRSGGFSENRL